MSFCYAGSREREFILVRHVQEAFLKRNAKEEFGSGRADHAAGRWHGPGFPAAALDSDLRVGTIVIDQFQTGDNKAAKLALKDGTLRMTLAAPDAHSMITFTTSRSNGYAELAFGDPGSTLEIDLGYLPQAGDLFKIIDVFGTNQSTGAFANGDTVDATFNGRVVTFDILYNSDLGGGDGNDVVLRMRPIPPTGTTLLIR